MIELLIFALTVLLLVSRSQTPPLFDICPNVKKGRSLATRDHIITAWSTTYYYRISGIYFVGLNFHKSVKNKV